MGISFSFFFPASLFSCVDYFIGVFDYSVGRSMFSCNHRVPGQPRDKQLFFLRTQNCFSQEVLEPYFSMGRYYR